jgi:hypothetical protein
MWPCPCLYLLACTGNPTNIIVADAYNMTFLGYSKFMALPTIGEVEGALRQAGAWAGPMRHCR